ncbi:MAG: hypothetical protein WBM13_11195 [Bacteroidia bacterium]
MRNVLSCIPRLLLLAEHLKNEELNEGYKSPELAYSHNTINIFIGMNGKCYPLFPFLIEELPNVFDEWYRSEQGYVHYLGAPEIVNNYALLEFFGLNIWPMLHCFSIGNQNTVKYGGFPLNRGSHPKDVAENILRYLESFQDEKEYKQMLFTRRVLVEKINPRHLNSINYLKKRRRYGRF